MAGEGGSAHRENVRIFAISRECAGREGFRRGTAGESDLPSSCHATRLLGVREEPGELLRNVKGLELIDLPKKEDCCGFGGTFSVKMADISEAMVCEKAGHVCSTGANVLIGSDMGCLMNIDGRLNKENKPVRVMHLAQVLEEGVKRSESKSRN